MNTSISASFDRSTAATGKACRLTAAVLAGLGGGFFTQAHATAYSSATNLPGTISIAAPPIAFDPATAADSAIAGAGYPPRPDQRLSPTAYANWLDAVDGRNRRITPILAATNLQHGPIRNRTLRIAAAATTGTANPMANSSATSINWSGFVAAAAAYTWGPASFTGVFGVWVVPIAQPKFGACSQTPNGAEVYSSTWVGLDGDGSADVLQAGTEADAVCSQGQVGAFYTPWYEWYPYNEVRVTNLPVAPGAAVYVCVWATSSTQGHAYIANRSTRQAVSLSFTAPPGTNLIGNSAEWIVERPAVGGMLTNLTNYVQEFFASAEAIDAQHVLHAPGGANNPSPALQVQMTDANTQVISIPWLLGRNSIWFHDGGSAM